MKQMLHVQWLLVSNHQAEYYQVPLKQPGDPEEVSIMLTPKKGLNLSKTSFITLCSKCTCVCLVTLSLELPFLLNPGQNLPFFTFNLTVN